MLTRRYIRHRRAWSPRFWPIALMSSVIVFVTSALLTPTLLEAIGIGFGVGAGVGIGRWELWKYRHPIVTADEYLTDMRRHAQWN